MRKLYQKVIILFIFLLIATTSFSANYLFILFDAGETNGLLPVIKKLKKTKNDNVFVLAEGASVNILKRKKIDFYRLNDFAKSEILFSIDKNLIKFEHTSGYHIPLRYASIQNIPDKAMKKIKPDVVVCGLVSFLERDFLKAATKRNIPAFGFYDFYDLPSENSIFLKVMPETNYVFVPNAEIAKGIRGRLNGAQQTIYASGHPSFSKLCSVRKAFNRKVVLSRAGIRADKKYFIFTTQYSKGNDKLLKLLIEAIKHKFKDYELILAPHPNQDPEHYKRLLAEENFSCYILDRTKMTTYEAMLASEIVFTETSTTGFEAVLLQKDLLHILSPEYPVDKLITLRKKLALSACNHKELINKIEQILSVDPVVKQIRLNVMKIAPIPNATNNIIKLIKEHGNIK